jgi:hypothetical protein
MIFACLALISEVTYTLVALLNFKLFLLNADPKGVTLLPFLVRSFIMDICLLDIELYLATVFIIEAF